MSSDTCIFALTQIAQEFGCEHGELVTRRTGPDIACNSESMRIQCECIYEKFKQVGLEEFGYEDDLTQVPHGIWAKIQFGGLLGLQSGLGVQGDNNVVNNIAEITTLAVKQYGGVEQLPYPKIVPAMQAYKLKRRRRR